MTFRGAALLILAFAAAAQNRNHSDDNLTRVLWQWPRPMTTQDWICGPGGCDRAPVSPFHFLREDPSQSTPKLQVRDVRGRTWDVKFGSKVIPECFASRFLHAVGYFAEDTYFVKAGTIEDVGRLRRTRYFVGHDGSFRRARFELRGQPDLVFLPGKAWSWADNPFLGTHELAGLKILMMLLSNWDAKDARDGQGEANTGVFRVPGANPSSGPELAFSVYDWGSTLGSWGGPWRNSRSDCAGYTSDTPKFVKGVSNGIIEFGYSGKHAEDLTRGITVADAEWLLNWLRPITGEQIRTGLGASGATDRQTGCWAHAIQNRIEQLEAVAR
jgi:hypothetical protein